MGQLLPNSLAAANQSSLFFKNVVDGATRPIAAPKQSPTLPSFPPSPLDSLQVVDEGNHVKNHELYEYIRQLEFCLSRRCLGLQT